MKAMRETAEPVDQYDAQSGLEYVAKMQFIPASDFQRGRAGRASRYTG